MVEQIIVIGTGRLPCACLAICQGLGARLACVEPEAQSFSPLDAACRKQGVPYQLLADKAGLNDFFAKTIVPTLVVSAYNIHLFSGPVLANPNLEIVNFHNSLLPRHRGRNAPTWAIFEMDAVTGVTWHRVTGKIDSGAIIAQKSIPLDGRITALELTRRTLDLGAELFREILPDLMRGRAGLTLPMETGEGQVHRSADVPNGGVLDLSWSAGKISAFLRSLDYGKFKLFPEPEVRLDGVTFKITGYRLADCGATPVTRVELDGMNLRILGDGLSIDAALAQQS